MSADPMLPPEEIHDIAIAAGCDPELDDGALVLRLARAIEQAVLQSPEVQAWKRDAERLDWLADPKNSIGNVQLPTKCVTENPHCLRAAIDAAMQEQKT